MVVENLECKVQITIRCRRCAANACQSKTIPLANPAKFSALVASHGSFHICRRFTNLRTRLILLKQDRLSYLEKQLEQIDREEESHIRLRCIQRDDNPKRKSIFFGK